MPIGSPSVRSDEWQGHWAVLKWWGLTFNVIYYQQGTRRASTLSSVPESADWVTSESWSAKGDVEELRQAYEGFHPDVRAVLDACPDCHKWAILEREPLSRWSDGRVVLLGDACHPMTPYMAQGAATAIEDAAALARCLDDTDGEDIEGSFQRYEAHRKPRTSLIQAISSANTWMKEGNRTPLGSVAMRGTHRLTSDRFCAQQPI
jgi:salicylate hydroxylase/6-hydroxynicotinate 3-monooxygenase